MAGRSPEWAATLSFWLPGLGQAYARAWLRAAFVGAGSAVCNSLAWRELPLTAVWDGDWPSGGPRGAGLWTAAVAIWLWNITDARRVAQRTSGGS